MIIAMNPIDKVSLSGTWSVVCAISTARRPESEKSHFRRAALLLAFTVMLFPSVRLMAGDAASLPESNTITLQEAYELYRTDRAIFIDARKEHDYRQAHIPKAVNIEPGRAKDRLEEIRHIKDTLLIIYCYRRGGVADRLATELRSQGITRFRLLEGNWHAWTKSGYPTTAGKAGG